MGERVVKAFLVLCPRRFRREFGPDVIEAFRQQRLQVTGMGARLKFWSRSIGDLLVTAIQAQRSKQERLVGAASRSLEHGRSGATRQPRRPVGNDADGVAFVSSGSLPGRRAVPSRVLKNSRGCRYAARNPSGAWGRRHRGPGRAWRPPGRRGRSPDRERANGVRFPSRSSGRRADPLQ